MKVVNLKKGPIAALLSTAVLFLILCYTFLLSSHSTAKISRDVHLRDIKDDGIRVESAAEFRGVQAVKEEKKEENRIEEKKEKKKGAEDEEVGKMALKAPKRTEEKEEEKLERVEGGGQGGTENDRRREFVKEMMLHAWYGYRNHTWGANEIRPIAKTPNNQAIFGGPRMAATIVDAADTLWIMGLKEEYQQARDFIKENFSISRATGTLSVFETTIRFIGGLLSLKALSGEDFYTDLAREVAEALLPAFNTPSGLSMSNIDMKSKTASNYGWANGGSSILAEFGSLHLEFVYLSHLTGQGLFAKKVKKIRDTLDRLPKPDGLYSNYINPNTGKVAGAEHVSLGALGDSFYEYLLKSWLQSGRSDEQARRMYWETSAAIQKKMVFTSRTGLRYVAELKSGFPDRKMGHLACFCVGMFAMEAKYEKDPSRKKEVMQLAEDLGATCHESYIRSASHIGPEMFYFNDVDDATSKRSEHGYILRPEVIEGFFYLWRITQKEMYRDWVWDAISSINKHCRREGGFAGLQNVYNPSQGSDDVQQSFFLAETLKYAFLTFSDSSLLSLDEWVFNTEAHPFPVLHNTADPSTAR